MYVYVIVCNIDLHTCTFICNIFFASFQTTILFRILCVVFLRYKLTTTFYSLNLFLPQSAVQAKRNALSYLSACAAGSYGENCVSTCGSCFGGAACDSVSGNCPAGCDPGWQGTMCQTREYLRYTLTYGRDII